MSVIIIKSPQHTTAQQAPVIVPASVAQVYAADESVLLVHDDQLLVVGPVQGAAASVVRMTQHLMGEV